jgi:hypothetical protein
MVKFVGVIIREHAPSALQDTDRAYPYPADM